ncbi:unnamed protein product [Closterium sp. NIES-53]
MVFIHLHFLLLRLPSPCVMRRLLSRIEQRSSSSSSSSSTPIIPIRLHFLLLRLPAPSSPRGHSSPRGISMSNGICSRISSSSSNRSSSGSISGSRSCSRRRRMSSSRGSSRGNSSSSSRVCRQSTLGLLLSIRSCLPSISSSHPHRLHPCLKTPRRRQRLAHNTAAAPTPLHLPILLSQAIATPPRVPPPPLHFPHKHSHLHLLELSTSRHVSLSSRPHYTTIIATITTTAATTTAPSPCSNPLGGVLTELVGVWANGGAEGKGRAAARTESACRCSSHSRIHGGAAAAASAAVAVAAAATPAAPARAAIDADAANAAVAFPSTLSSAAAAAAVLAAAMLVVVAGVFTAFAGVAGFPALPSTGGSQRVEARGLRLLPLPPLPPPLVLPLAAVLFPLVVRGFVPAKRLQRAETSSAREACEVRQFKGRHHVKEISGSRAEPTQLKAVRALAEPRDLELSGQ